ncbi:MAG: T9SS type A sorting domain-containing protein, partial [Chitinophagales bacterium]
ISITVHSLPQPVISSQGSLSFCDGGSVVLDAGSGYKSYKWSNNKYGQSLTVSTTGNFNVTVTDYNNCSNASSTVNVLEHPPIPSIVTINGPTAFCDGKSPTYLTGPAGFETYQWSKGSSYISGATDKKYTPSTSGTYKITITDNFSCSTQSDGVVITILNPPKAKVTTTDSKNICGLETCLLMANSGSGYTYQWMKNGVDIPGAILVFYIAGTPGDYKVRVYGANGCKENSKVTTITSYCKETDQKNIPDAEPLLSIYPNPASNLIHLQAELSGENPVAYLEITNLLGEVVYVEEQSLNGKQFYSEVQLNSRFTNGVYIARVHCGAEVIVSNFIVSGNQ